MPTLKLYVLGNLIDSMPISFQGVTGEEKKQRHLNGMIHLLKSNNSASLVVHPFEIYLDNVESMASAYIQQNSVDERQRRHEERMQRLKLKAMREKKQAELKPVKKKIMDNKYEAPDVKQPFVRPKAEYSNMRLYDLV